MRRLVSVIAVAALASGCHRTFEEAAGEVVPRSEGASVEVYLASGELLGTLQLAATTGTARLTGALHGLAPGRHGIHVHAVGKCDGPAFESAGGHFNPTGRKHGLSNPAGPHAGDAPNIAADAARHAVVDVTLALAPLAESPNGLFDADGSALVIHAHEDDQMTDPAGNSGARIACGVVRRN